MLRPLSYGVALIALLAAPAMAQRGQPPPDPDYHPALGPAAYADGEGPLIAIDAGHDNMHTVDGTYLTFARIARSDGFRVAGRTGPFTADALRDVDILVIANATDPTRAGGPALREDEASTVADWIAQGGGLVLVADHQPWPAAVEPLARRLGVEFANAFAYDGPEGEQSGSLFYRRSDGSLGDHAVTAGVDQVGTFLGSAFRVPGPHVPLLRMSASAVARPQMGTARTDADVPIGGWLQGALLERGQGRVAVFGEAAMLSAQVRGTQLMGMNAPGAEDNARLLRNVLRWLARTP